MITISKRGQEMPASPIRKLKPFADEAIAKGKTIYHLNIGQPDIETPVEMLDVLKKFDGKIIAYGPSRGVPEYHEALIEYYKNCGINLEKRDLIVTTGGSEAILMGMTVCLDPGDEILIPEPFYANYNGFAVAAGVKIVPVTTKLENNWELPPSEEIEGLISKKTKAIMICNPNNPTGKVYSRSELEKIVELSKKYNLFIFGDEVYREFIFSGEKHTSLLDFEDVRNRVVVMDSISKRFSSCGARIGAIISRNQEIMSAVLSYAQARLCAPTLEQLISVPSVKLGSKYFSSILDEYRKRRDIVVECLSQMKDVKYKIPSGAFYIIVKLPVKDAEYFSTWLLTSFSIENETVMVAPASGFYNTKGLGRDEIRIAFVLNEEKTRKAMNILRTGLEEYISG